MPVFLGWSGYFFGQYRRGLSDLWTRSWPRYVCPWVIATAVFFAILWWSTGKLPFTLEKAVLNPWFHLWYIPCLLFFSIIGASRKLPASALLPIFLTPHILLAFGADIIKLIGNIDDRYIYYGTYFAIGVVIKQLNFKTSIGISILVLTVGILASIATFHMRLAPWQLTLIRCMIVAGTICAVKAYPHGRTWLGSSVFATENLGIYLYHFVAIMIVRSQMTPSGPWYWAAAIIASMIALPALILVLRRLPGSSTILGPQADARKADNGIKPKPASA